LIADNGAIAAGVLCECSEVYRKTQKNNKG